MKHDEWHVPGYGTEKVGPFLSGLVGMARPQRILEIGFGYTTPFLIESLKDNFELHWDSNCDPNYLQKPYDPKLVVIDDQSLETDSDRSNRRREYLKEQPSNLVHFIEGDFKDSKIIEKVSEIGPYDLVWFDCGGPDEYQFFIHNYWGMVKEYALFHFTFFKEKENKNGQLITEHLKSHSSVQRLDIIEPHKFKQGSVTMLRKIHE